MWEDWGTERLNNCLRSCPQSRSIPGSGGAWFQSQEMWLWSERNHDKGEEASGVTERSQINPALHDALRKEGPHRGSHRSQSVSTGDSTVPRSLEHLQCVGNVGEFLGVPTTEGHACPLVWEARDAEDLPKHRIVIHYKVFSCPTPLVSLLRNATGPFLCVRAQYWHYDFFFLKYQVWRGHPRGSIPL